MFGLIVKFSALPGRRDDFIRIITTGFRDMPGCHSYILAKDAADDVSIWVTEVWDTIESHDSAIKLPHVVAATNEAKPLLAGRDSRVVTTPVGGHGLTS